jgi:hypothetical protein
MRVSARPDDLGYIRNRSGICVYLDGERVFDCVLADEDAGFVIVRPRDSAGRLIVDGDRVREVERRGNVVISHADVASSSASSAGTARRDV